MSIFSLRVSRRAGNNYITMLFSKEDIEAWKEATRNVRRFLHLPDWDFSELQEDIAKPVSENVPHETISINSKQPKLSSPAYYPDLIEGEAGRMDANSFSALKKGKMKFNIVEDLHGMNVVDARMYFYELIKLAHASKKRSILLITGKGFLSPSKIRASLNNWINDPDLKPLILTYCRAQPKDGGDGAFYIYLAK